ncbi:MULTISPECIES: NUDIX hydrolase [unclassified Brevundimonas]|uniref:NUDIX hydrolase n=1 Tax=unclassified Brevundimonas TaxID=2622653 RepID=UPI0025C4FEE4|nr:MULTISPECIES: NUDIX hydrolase [unclassified Brevundimonas]
MSKSRNDNAIHQIAALPWRRRGDAIEVLLITSRETKRWVIAKGNPMVDLADPQAAAQEAYEEAGVQGDISRKAIGAYPYDKRMKDGRLQPCLVDVYPLEVLIQLGSWPEAEQRKRQWMSVDEAASKVHEPELASLIRGLADTTS